jgi:hypothetical protein
VLSAPAPGATAVEPPPALRATADAPPAGRPAPAPARKRRRTEEKRRVEPAAETEAFQVSTPGGGVLDASQDTVEETAAPTALTTRQQRVEQG